MKPTTDDFEPRRDGWYEHRGTWGEVTVGTVVGTSRRTDAYEVIATAMAQPVEYAKTLWFQMRHLGTGEVITVPPKAINLPVVILTKDPLDTKTPPVEAPSNAEAVALLVRELGAMTLASRDETTGEITCPTYEIGHTHLDGEYKVQRGLVEHLSLAHGVPDQDIIDPRDIGALVNFHGRCHSPKWDIGKGGFPHRHVPEDHSII